MRRHTPDELLTMARERPGGKVTAVALPAAEAPAKRSKYGAIRTEYDGVLYDSKAEAAYALMLDDELRAGLIAGWTRQVRFHLGCPENCYVVDFLVFGLDGCGVWAVDVKGVETAKFRKDRRLWLRYGPCNLKLVKKGLVDEIIKPKRAATAAGEGR
jgi:hypothetical protein